VIVEEPPLLDVPVEDESAQKPERPAHVLALSARNESALRDVAAAYSTHLAGSDEAIADFCFSANTGRAQFNERLAITAQTRDEFVQALGPVAAGASPTRNSFRSSRAAAGDLAFVFTGQGAQRVGMGRELY